MSNLPSDQARKIMELGRRLLQSQGSMETPISDVLRAPKPLSARDLAKAEKIAKKAAERIALWYPQVSSGLGAFLLDPNVVLTLGDARGHTEFSARGTTKEIEKLNDLSSKVGILFNVESNSESEKVRDLFVGITSKVGLEKVAAASKLRGLPKFFAAGYDHPWLWFHRALSETDALPALPLTTEDREHIVMGVMKGYPDRAVLSLRTLDRDLWAHTRIRCANYYNCAQPNFSYDPLDAHGISKLAGIWGEALSRFYKSKEHLDIKTQAVFVQERLKSMDKTMKWYLAHNRSPSADVADSSNDFDRMLLEMRAWRESAARFLEE